MESKRRKSPQWRSNATRRLRRFKDPAGIAYQLLTRPRPEAEYRARIYRQSDAENTLERLALGHARQPFTKSWHYLDFYHQRIGKLAEESRLNTRDQPLRVLEIGVWRGGSLQLWRDYFGDNATIFGIDIEEACRELPGIGCEIRIGSQTDAAFLNRVVDEMGGVDIVIDDGSHICADVVTSFQALWPRLSEGGSYFVEDLHTSYWPQWRGGLRRPGSSIEFFKDLADVVNGDYFRGSPFRRDQLDQAGHVSSIEFADSLVLVRKRLRGSAHIFYGGQHDAEYLAAWGASPSDAGPRE